MTRNSRAAVAILIALVFAIGVSLFKDTDQSSLTLRGDFPAFFAAAQIALSGEGEKLYSEQTQQAVENAHWPSLKGRYYYFAYPPYVAVLLSPLALLPPLVAKGVITLLMLASLWLSARYLGPFIRADSQTIVLFALLLCFAPVFISVLAGQNVSLSMLLYTFMLCATRLPEKKRALILGLACGIWAFKPQYAVIALVLLYLAGQLRAVGWALLPLSIYYLLGVLLLGWHWPIEWLAAVARFNESDYIANQHQMISLLGFGRSLGGLLFGGLPATDVFFSLLSLALFVHAGWLAFRVRSCQQADTREELLLLVVALLGPLTILASPHSLFYELGLCLVALAVSVRQLPSPRILFLLWSIVALLCFLHEYWSIDLLALFAVASYFLVYLRATEALQRSRAETT